MKATEGQIRAGKKFGLDLTDATSAEAERILGAKMSQRQAKKDKQKLDIGQRVSYVYKDRTGTITKIDSYGVEVRWDKPIAKGRHKSTVSANSLILAE